MAFSGSINFISASLTGSDNINVDFVGLNTLIIDVVSGSSNNLGIPASLDSAEYYNSNIEVQGDPANPNQLNSLLLNRNGPYQHPSWKQSRGGDHPIARKLRMNNTMSVDIRDPDPDLREERKRNERYRLEDIRPNQNVYTVVIDEAGAIESADYIISSSHPTNPGVPQSLGQFYVPVLTSKHKPLVYTVTSANANQMKVRASFMNQMMDFSSEDQNAKLKFSSGDPSTGSYDIPGEKTIFKSSNTKIHGLIRMAKAAAGHNFIYSERIFPKEINSYKDYKLEKPNYEQSSGVDGYDSHAPRLFWKDTQGGGTSLATSNGTTRLRTDGVAKNSAGVKQQTTFPESYNAIASASARQLISSSVNFVSSAFGVSPTALGTASYTNNATTTSFDLGLQGLIVEYINNGVVINRYQTPINYLPLPGTNAHVSGVIFQLDAYQPYEISLLSSWPLDARDDIYLKPPYLTSSIGGKGLQIGLTPHKNSSLINSSLQHHNFTKLSGTLPATTSSIISITSGLKTGSAGELVYSTKPSIFFWRNTNTHSTSSMSFVVGASTTVDDLFHEAVFGSGDPVEKFELQDIQGNRVGFAFHSGSATTDGSTMVATGSTVVEIGINGLINNAGGVVTLLKRVEATVNSVNSAANGLSLNISASYGTGASSEKVLVFHQETFGTGPTNMMVSGVLDNFITGPKFLLKGIDIYAGNYLAESTDTDDMFKGPGAGTVQSLRDDAIMGYKSPTASLQYNRHTFPYNTPFYVGAQIRGRNPFYNSYNDFIDNNLKHFGRDYSIFSEFKYSDNIKYYNSTLDGITSNEELLYSIQDELYTDQDNKSKKIIRNANINANIVTADIHKANSRVIEGGSITSSAGVETYPLSSTRYSYDDLSGPYVQTTTALPKENYLSDFTSTKFDYEYEQSDSTKNFSFTLDSLVSGYSEGDQTIPSKIKLKASVIKKLLPYNGFFPATRTVQIGSALINDFTGALGFSGQMDASAAGQISQDNKSGPAYAQALLEPLMAPGILYNSIKSGVAVDYPIYTQKPNYFNPSDFSSVKNENGVGLAALQSTFHGGLYMMGASRCIPSILTSLHDKRLPFRALYDLDELKSIVSPSQGTQPSVHLISDFIDVDRATKSPHTAYPEKATSGSIDINNPNIKFPDGSDFSLIKKGTYLSMINNYLSETMEFFLADLGTSKTKLPVVVSSFVDETSLKEGQEYTFEASLHQGKYNIMCEGPRKAGIGNPEGILEKTGTDSGYYVRNSSMRGYIYGPPLETVQMVSADRHSGVLTGDEWDNENFEFKHAFVNLGQYEDYLAANLQDPAYHAYTPPYFYGKSSVVYRVTPTDVTSYTTQELVQKLTNPGADAVNRTFFVDEYTLPASGSNSTHRFIVDEDSLLIGVPTTGSASKASTAKMKINSSVPSNGKLIEVNKFIALGPLDTNPITITDHIWAIYPEWVCPVLDFSGSISAIRKKIPAVDPDNNYNLIFNEEIDFVDNTFHDKTTGRGMWGGYGTDPYDSKLVEASLTRNGIAAGDLQAVYKNEKGIYFSIDDFSSTSDTENNQSANSTFILDTDDEKFATLLDTTTAKDSHSLLNRLGLAKTKLPVGKFADSKDISEAIVLIPYLDKEISLKTNKQAKYNGGENFDQNRIYQTREIVPGKHFLPIHERLFENILSLYITEKTIGPGGAEALHLYGTINDKFSSDVAKGAVTAEDTVEVYLEHARTEATENTDVGRLIDKISAHSENGGYMVPPEFDFVHNKNVAPFQMFVIPFNETLDKQDLIDIYQGVMPESSLHIQKDQSSAEADVTFIPTYGELYIPDFPTEFGATGITNFLSPSLFLDEDIKKIEAGGRSGAPNGTKLVLGPQAGTRPSILPYTTSREFYRNLRFMVFKVKQRSKKDYSNYKLSQIYKAGATKLAELDASNTLVTTKPEQQMVLYKTPADVYGSNWPYDNFSLIESGKIDIEIEVNG